MPDIRLEREFNVTPERLFDFVTKRASVLEWFGYEGMTFPADEMDFSRTGPWFVEMLSKDGNKLKLSGHVTHVDRPNSIGFTWAWHDEDDKRGVESHVTIKLVPAQNGTVLQLSHVDLPEESAESHKEGWGSTFNKLEALLND